MKVMHLTSGGDVGGAKTHVLTLLQELGKRHQVHLVCFIDGPFAQEARAMGIHTRVLKKGALSQRRELLKCIEKWQVELVHCHGAKANAFAALIRGRVSIPLISTVHSDPRLDYLGRPFANLTFGTLNRMVLPRQDGWVAISDSIKELLIDCGYDADRIWPIYNGIVFPEKEKYVPRQAYLNGLGLDWNENHVIFGIAARITAVKDLSTLVRAFAGTLERAPNARLLIAGDGEQRPQIESLVRELCPAGTVHFAGWQSDMDSFYHCLDVNMLSSISEAFPYAIPEGGRMHCATISTAVGGVPKVVIDGETGFLVESGDWEKMRDRMIQVALDGKLRSRLGRNLYEKVRREFSAEAMAEHQLRIYESVLNRYYRHKAGRYGAVVCGAYGKGNAGDDAILVSLIRQLRQQDPDLPVCVMTRQPRETARMTGISTVHMFDVIRVGRRMRRSQLYISGGGSLIQNVTSTRSLMYYLFSIAQAKRSGCKVMMYGCGIGPVFGQSNQRRAGRVLDKYVDLITLRDPDSRKLLEQFGVEGPEIHVTADPALLMEGDEAAACRYLEGCGLDPEGKYGLFVLRPWEDAQQKLEAICGCADLLWERCGVMPLFLAFEPNRDNAITQQAGRMVKAPAKVLNPASDGAVLCGLIAKMELVVSMRLHALIFACGQNTPVVGISYDPKVSGFLDYLGIPACVELSQVTREKLWENMEQALNRERSRTKVDQLKTLAAQNGILAGKLLRQ